MFFYIYMYFNIVAGILGKGEHLARIYGRYKFVTCRQVEQPSFMEKDTHKV